MRLVVATVRDPIDTGGALDRGPTRRQEASMRIRALVPADLVAIHALGEPHLTATIVVTP